MTIGVAEMTQSNNSAPRFRKKKINLAAACRQIHQGTEVDCLQSESMKSER